MKRVFYTENVREAAKYLASHPGALWARNEEECLDALSEEWDIVAISGDKTLEVATSIAEGNFPQLHATPIKVYGEDCFSKREAVRRLLDAGYEAKRLDRPE